jgi:hypothetical protein
MSWRDSITTASKLFIFTWHAAAFIPWTQCYFDKSNAVQPLFLNCKCITINGDYISCTILLYNLPMLYLINGKLFILTTSYKLYLPVLLTLNTLLQ